MNPKHLFQNLQRAAKLHPACRRVSIWTVARDSNGHELVGPDGSYEWSKLCHAHAVYDFGQPDEWAGATGEYSGTFKISILPDPVTLNPLALPDLGDTFMVRRYSAFPGDPTPEVSLAMTRTGGDAMGFKQVFLSREPLAGDVAPAILADG
ncbi:hypothetical protein [Paracoccus aminovorans]|uniref:hypothetical protein n=1 Tax=Paracoccus aminovorans TaxID=34004 RepID=UPI002B2645F7|nr:hypothetical protein [Paracoccus aminovorans]